MSKFFKIALCSLIVFTFSSKAIAQNANSDVDQLVNESKNDLLIVVSGGLAGAILGLSTLSFVEEPKEHTRNILVGASIGIIAGVGYVAFSQANKSKELLYGPSGEEAYKSSANFGTFARLDWHHEKFQEQTSTVSAPAQLGYSFRY